MQLEVEVASKAFTNVAGERQQVLADINFALGDGEVAVLFGPSGCGKSTLLRILAGLDRDFTGRVSRPPGARIGMVFQEPRLLPWRSVEDNVRLAAPDVTVGSDETSATGVVRGVVYLGPDTRYVVDLDAGARLVVTEQNLTTTSTEVLEQQGKAVRLIWKRQHGLPVADGSRPPEEEEQHAE